MASISAQEASFRDVVARDSLAVRHWLTEDKSAMVPHNRPVFTRLIEMLQSGEVNAILCWHVDRLSRNALESGLLQQLLHDGVIQCVKTPERIYRPEDHALLFALEASMAVQYSRDLRRNVRRGVEDKVANGWYPYSAKPGYRVEKNGEIVLHPEQFPLLRRTFELVLSGDYSIERALHATNSMGYQTEKTRSGGGKPMNRSTLHRILHDPFYTGSFSFDGVEHQGKHTPLITKEEFDKVQRILGRSLVAKPQKHFHRYAGLMRCGVCGCQITVETKVKQSRFTGRYRTYTYYHCTGRKGCPKSSVSEEQLDHQVAHALKGCSLHPAFAAWAEASLTRDEVAIPAHDLVQSQATSETLTHIARKLGRLQEMREDNELTADEFKARRSVFLARKAEIEQDLRRNEEKATRDTATLKNLLSFTAHSHTRFVRGGPEEKRQVALSFATGYVLTQGNLTVSLHPGLETIRTFEPQNNRDHQIGPGDSGPGNPGWRALWDELRETVARTDVPFAP